MWDVPVAPGETFRWVFVTSQSTVGHRSEIDYYNDWINNFVMSSLSDFPISGVAGKDILGDIQWKAIASTEEVDAFDNIGGLSDVGVYNPLGTLIDVSTNAMFVGGLLYPINVNQYGGVYNWRVWTGSLPDGSGYSGYTLGAYDVAYGFPLVGDGWLYSGVYTCLSGELCYPQYAMSEVLTVVPVPGALILGATGLLSSTLGLIRLRRKDQEPSQI